MLLSPGDLLATKYRIETEIGRGAFGRVYRARDIDLDRVVAIKELHRGEDDLGSTQFSDYVRRFEREARVQARFNHPNIVHVYELLRLADDRLYLVMEFVDGESLRDTLARRGPLPVDEAVRIMLDLLAGLAAVHADPRDIIHRDVKPSNVLLTKGGQAKLSDFGLAQEGDESIRSAAGQPHPGTPAYMSPEQASASDYLYPASDVFSAGCVLFELLTGVIFKQARRRKQGLIDLRPDAPKWLVEVLTRALAKDSDDRPADAGELARLLREGAEQVKAELEAKRQAETARLTELRRKEQDAEQARLHQEEERRQAEAKAQAEAAERARQAELKRRQEEERRQAEAKAQAEAAEQARQSELKRRKEEERCQAKAKAQVEAADHARQAEAKRQRKELLLELAPNVALELVRIPAGEFLLGSDKAADPLAHDNELPQHRLYLPEYLIGKYPVTVAQFAAFVKATGYKTTAEQAGSGWTHAGGSLPEVKGADWAHPRGPGSDVAQEAEHPVTLVSWDDANAFSQWASQATGRMIRLPTEAEWEKAARGTDGRLFPWGNTAPTDKLCNFDMNCLRTTTVWRSSPQGDSPYGCADMAGNVWEWTRSLWGKDMQRPTFGYPYVAGDGREDLIAGADVSRVLRGGAFDDGAQLVRCACRHHIFPEFRVEFIGFRVASSGL